jgi:hypothetical protein
MLTDLEQWTGKREAGERDFIKVRVFVTLLDLVPPGAGAPVQSARSSTSCATPTSTGIGGLWLRSWTGCWNGARRRPPGDPHLEDSHHP